MAVPQIDLLPDPALPTDPEDVFDAKVGASLTAEQHMVPQINVSLMWIGQQITVVDGYRQAAAQSASDASGSAGAANAAKNAAAQSALEATNNGKAQVALAAAQVALAQAARAGAESAAQAAGAAAGLPSGRTPLTVLKVLPNGQIGWGPRDPVGEVVIAVTAQDASYIQTGGVYLQASYPELFQLIGKIATPGVYSFQGVTNTSGYLVTDVDTDGNGTWIAAVSNTTGTTSGTFLGYVLRSTDDGLTWSAVSIPRLINAKVRYAAGIWMCTGSFYDSTNEQVYCAHSTDGGITWSAARQVYSGTGGTLSNPRALATNEIGELALLSAFSNSSGSRSAWTSKFIPGSVGNTSEWTGYAFTGPPFSQQPNAGLLVQGLVYTGNYLLVYGVGGNLVRVTVVAAGTSAGTVVNSRTTSDLKGGAAKNGTILIAGSNGAVIRSTDLGATFLPVAVSAATNFVSVEAVGGGVWLLGASDGSIWISMDDGFTVTNTTPSGVSTPVENIRNALGTVVIASKAVIRRSKSLYSYDQTTQFIVPSVAAPSGLKSFIKARAAA